MKRITGIGLLGIIVLLAGGGLDLRLCQIRVKREVECQRDRSRRNQVVE